MMKNEEEDKKEILEELFLEKNLTESIDLDRKWLDKELKTLTKKLDIGFTLKGSKEDFNDPMKYSVSKNADGTINITLKNVQLIEQ